MIESLVHDLTRLGFSDKEASVYVAVLRLGVATAPEIAQTSGVNRATTHDVLAELARRGLVTPFVENSEKRFTAEPADRILTVLHLQRREIEDRMIDAESIVPRLSALHNVGGFKPKIRYIEGIDGLRAMQREYEIYEGEIIQLVGYDAFMALADRRTTSDHRSTMKQKDRRVRAMLVTDRQVEFPDLPNYEVRCVSPAIVAATGEMSVCGDRVLLFSYATGIIAIEIRSQSIADTCRATLELAWKASEFTETWR